MRIRFQKHTVIGRNPWLDEAYVKHCEQLVGGVEVEFASLPEGVYSGPVPADLVKYGQLEVLFSWYFADQARAAERSGCEAYIIGTSQDPGLAMARSLVSIPVVGYGSTTFGFLHGQGLRFGVIGFIRELEEVLRSNMRAEGWMSSCVGFEYLPEGRALVESTIASGDPSGLLAAMAPLAARLKASGAQVLVSGEGLENEVLWAHGVRDVAGLKVIDSNGLALMTAVMHAQAVKLGVWASGDDGYFTRRADPEEVERIRGVLF